MGRTAAAAAARRRAEGNALKYFVEDPGTGTLYKRGQLLGQGAFGQCYKFTDTCANRVYAVKVVSQQRISRLGNQGKVQREIELHSQLQHRNIVGFHRHFADQENIYMVLEYCSRKSLAHILKVRGMLTEPEVRFYLKQIINGLQYLHQQGIIHRDLKLSNVFITKSMQVKIGDLGLATREQACQRRGVVCGTPNYLAPEVIAKKGHSFKSDIWALGCIMYTALAGFSPFEITHKQELYERIREGLYHIPSHLSPAARGLIGKLLAPDPSARPSLEEVLQHPFFTQVVQKVVRMEIGQEGGPLLPPSQGRSSTSPTPRSETRPKGPIPETSPSQWGFNVLPHQGLSLGATRTLPLALKGAGLQQPNSCGPRPHSPPQGRRNPDR